MTTLTPKETKAIIAIFEDAGNGCTTAEGMKNDNMTWFNVTTIMAVGFSREAASGLMSSLEEKGMSFNYDEDHEYGWILTDSGIDMAVSLIALQQVS